MGIELTLAASSLELGSQPSILPAGLTESNEKTATKGKAQTDAELQQVDEKLDLEDDDELWEKDPAHPRNWSFRSKWVAVSIVRPNALYWLQLFITRHRLESTALWHHCLAR